jgi:hypothetical protein
MQKPTALFSVQLIGIFFILFCSGIGTAIALEAPGSPFVLVNGGETARTYSGTVTAGQQVIVAYERDVVGTSTCSAADYTPDTAGLDNITSQALHGTVGFTTAPNQTIIPALENSGCFTAPVEAGSIFYTADIGYVGADSFTIQLGGAGDIITVNIIVVATGEEGGVAVIGPVLLQSSIKQTTSMISSRVKRLITPQSFFRSRHTKAAPSAQVTPKQNDPLAFIMNPTSQDKPNRQKRDLTDIVQVSVDSQTIGLSAGDASMKHGIWTNIAYTSSEDDNLITESDMDINSYILGYDYKLSDSMAIGVSVTYEDIDADLNFNSGSLEGDGYTIAPYFTMLLTDYMSMDIIAGYALVEYNQDRNFGTVTSSVDADRQFAQFTVNGFHYIDQWSFNLNLSFLYAHEGQDSYTESDGTKIKSNNIDFSQLSIGTEVAYGFKYVEPYITLAYEQDTQYVEITGTSYDKNGGDGGVGCRMFFSDQLSGDIYGSTKFGRDDYDEYSVLGNLRYDF